MMYGGELDVESAAAGVGVAGSDDSGDGLFWAAVITAIVLAIRYLTGAGGHRNPIRLRRVGRDVLAEALRPRRDRRRRDRKRLTLLREHR